MIAVNVMEVGNQNSEHSNNDRPRASSVSSEAEQSTMRLATEPRRAFDAIKNKKQRIIARRGAFEYLPVLFSNDLVHGSWWFVLGSLVAMLIPIVPLLDLFYSFWYQSGTLPILQDATTFFLLIASGFFFTLGSLAFVRATEDPPVKPLFSWTHLATDELLAAWLFLLGTVPFPAFVAVYLVFYPTVIAYWVSLFASLIFVVATYMFVLACYPTDEPRDQIIPYLFQSCCRESKFMRRHMSNDWLAATWIFFWGTALLCVGSLIMLALGIRSGNQLEIFDWATSTLDAFIFLVGSAYFCAGSYPDDVNKMVDESMLEKSEPSESDPLLKTKDVFV